MIVAINFDGACEPVNPGGVGTWGFIIRDLPGRSVPVYGVGIVEPLSVPMTNNVAEWVALGKALAFVDSNYRSVLKPASEHSLLISGDSKLVVEQLSGRWACNAANLRPLLARCRELLTSIGCPWSATWVKRDFNTAADSLTQAAYVGATGKPFPVREKKK